MELTTFGKLLEKTTGPAGSSGSTGEPMPDPRPAPQDEAAPPQDLPLVSSEEAPKIKHSSKIVDTWQFPAIPIVLVFRVQ